MSRLHFQPAVKASVGLWLAVLACWGCEPQEVEVDVPPPLQYEPQELAARIRATYDRHLVELPLARQIDYTTAMYRFTGEARELDILAYDLRKRARSFVQRVDALATRGYAERSGWEILAGRPVLTDEQKRRRAIFETHPELLVYRRVLTTADDVRSHGVHEGLLAGHYGRALEHLRHVDHRAFVLDANVIRVDARGTAAYVLRLERLGVADLVAEFIEVFRELYLQRDASQLARREYRNQLRGMTGLILAASREYQEPVSARRFAWILDYFDRHILEISSAAKPDIVAEIGACFKLCGQPDHDVVHLVQRYLVGAFDSELGFIPTTTRNRELAGSEPLNRLAFYVLSDSASVHAGPALTDADLGFFSPVDLFPTPGFPSHVSDRN